MCFLLALAPGTPGRADAPLEIGSSIVVEAPTATPAATGERSIIRFRVVNGSSTSVVLLNITTPVAQEAKLIATVSASSTVALDSVAVSAGETLDLTTSHLRFEIFPLRRPLVSGDEFPVTLKFVNFSVPVSVHVH